MSNERPLDLRSLPSAREVISHYPGGLFPVQTVLANGEIAVISRGGAGHLGQAGNLCLARSRDNGKTWTPPTVIVDSDEDDRNPAMGVAPDGTLVLAYMLQRSYTEEREYTPSLKNADVCVMRSSDNGLSWTSPELLDPAVYSLMSPFGRIITLNDGSLLMPIYTAGGTATLAAGSYFLRSSDNGVTWSEPHLIALDRDETSVIQLPSGDLLAACRETAREFQRLWTCRSSDGGETWTEQELVTDAMQHPADLVMLDDERLLLVHGNRQAPYQVQGRISRDEGRTWESRLVLVSGQLYGYDIPSPRRTDLGYPTAVISADGSTLVVTYYYNPYPRIQEHRGWTGIATTPFYKPDGYRGVSLSVDLGEVLAAIG
jgi:photosystem II stability/assembly factor-like uncharacterized protein